MGWHCFCSLSSIVAPQSCYISKMRAIFGEAIVWFSSVHTGGTFAPDWHDAALQRLQVNDHLTKALQFGGHLVLLPLIKVNTDGVAFGGLDVARCAGFIRTCRDFVKGCFAILLGVCFAFKTELVVVVHMIENASSFSWRRLWLESDSPYLVALLRSYFRQVSRRWHSV